MPDATDNLRRLEVMRGEAARRQKTWSVMGLTDTDENLSSSHAPSALLVLSMGSNDARINRSRPHGVQTIQAFPGRPLRDSIASNQFGAVIIDCDVRGAADQIAEIRRDPNFADWPILAIYDVPSLATDLKNAGATLVFSADELLSALVEVPVLIEENTMRRSLSQVLKAMRTEHVDRSTFDQPLIDRSVFEHHLARMLMDAADGDTSAQPTSLLVLTTADGQDQQALKTASAMLPLLVRGEDLPAKLTEAQIAVSMPGTTQESAQSAADRIQSVLDSTKTGPGEGKSIGRFHVSLVTTDGQERADDFLLRATSQV